MHEKNECLRLLEPGSEYTAGFETSLLEAFTKEDRVLFEEAEKLKPGLPALYVCAGCPSTFDVAWRLIEKDALPEWGAVLALRQSAGRGQLRRAWQSPAGNLHVSVRLPERLRHESTASVLTGLLLIEAFARLGLPLQFKWPNDLILSRAGAPGKFGGILLEERSSVLLAGVGLNLARLPDPEALRQDAALPAALPPADFPCRSPILLWLELVQNVISVYRQMFMATAGRQLLNQAEKYLLWKDFPVQVANARADGSCVEGLLSGLDDSGGLRLTVPGPGNGRELVLHSGSLKRACRGEPR